MHIILFSFSLFFKKKKRQLFISTKIKSQFFFIEFLDK